ncbi:MAG: histidinol-phosphatase [Clostridia bacterium]|nr:histidinol-phosphatase [Clostridia bacterium]
MRPSDLHVHTTFCDGAASPEEMVRAALELGCRRLGFSAHAPMPFEGYALPADREDDYRAEILRLKEVYRGRIEILLGLELDLYSLPVTKPYDYLIGSVHFFSPVTEDGTRREVDGGAEPLRDTIDRYFGGDPYAAAEDYFASVARLRALSPTVIGHLDLIRKYNRGAAFFDELSPRYLTAARRAIDALLPLDVPFEVNTGAVSRGYRETPYPAAPLLAYVLKNGGKVILTSDAHKPEGLCYEFDKWAEYVRMFG